MNEINGRPEWAQGPEWDGWEPYKDRGVVRDTRKGSGWMVTVCMSANRFSVSNGAFVRTPSAALAIANIIAEDRGGWA